MLVPVVFISSHYPDFVLRILKILKWPSPWIGLDFTEIVVVVLKCLLADDHVPAAGDRRHHKINWTRVRQLEFDRVLVACVDLADRLEQYAPRDADALRWFDDPVEGRLHVVSRQLGPVVKLNV